MKHALALILACSALLAFSGCAKMKGQRIEFGHTYECDKLRGKVYHITFDEDARQIMALKDEVGRFGCTQHRGFILFRDPDEPRVKSSHNPYQCRQEGCYPHLDCMRLHDALEPYAEGFFGWF
jgi:hypothetical protein